MAAPQMTVLVEDLVPLFPADGQVNNQGPLGFRRPVFPSRRLAGREALDFAN